MKISFAYWFYPGIFVKLVALIIHRWRKFLLNISRYFYNNFFFLLLFPHLLSLSCCQFLCPLPIKSVLTLENCFSPESACGELIFFFKLFIFNWRIIALQYCVGFSHETIWINHRYMYVTSLLNLPPTSHSNPLL